MEAAAQRSGRLQVFLEDSSLGYLHSGISKVQTCLIPTTHNGLQITFNFFKKSTAVLEAANFKAFHSSSCIFSRDLLGHYFMQQLCKMLRCLVCFNTEPETIGLGCAIKLLFVIKKNTLLIRLIIIIKIIVLFFCVWMLTGKYTGLRDGLDFM